MVEQHGVRAGPIRGVVGAAETVDPDLDIVELAKDPASRSPAMGVLYERFQERVYNVALRIVGAPEDASDVLQDVFILLFRKIHKFRARAAFASWVYRITVNVSLDRLRQKKRSPLWNGGATPLDVIEDGSRRTIPENRAALKDLEAHVERALGHLSPRLRIVIVLRYLEGLSYNDIAEILGCSLGTVKSRLNRAHAHLRRALGPVYGAGGGVRSA